MIGTVVQIPTVVYRIFNSADVLLYVGCTDNLKRRMDHHAKRQRWWDEVSRIETEWHPSRTEAECAEDQAIAEERPLYNIAGLDPQLRVTWPNAPATFPDWPSDTAQAILRQVGALLNETELSHAHARLRCMQLLLTGQDDLPRGAALVALAAKCGVSERAAYRLSEPKRAA